MIDDLGMEIVHRWIEADLGEGWTAAARMITREGHPEVAELRIFPTPTAAPSGGMADRPLGTWDQDDATVPAGGITDNIRRRPSLRRIKEREHQIAHHLGLTDAVQEQPLPEIPRRPGKKGRPIEDDARIAAIYVDELVTGTKGVIARTAAKLGTGYTTSYVRKRISRCRELGLLTPTTEGRAGGTLTPLALAALRGKSRGST